MNTIVKRCSRQQNFITPKWVGFGKGLVHVEGGFMGIKAWQCLSSSVADSSLIIVTIIHAHAIIITIRPVPLRIQRELIGGRGVQTHSTAPYTHDLIMFPLHLWSGAQITTKPQFYVHWTKMMRWRISHKCFIYAFS